jgi:hypothetical protein
MRLGGFLEAKPAAPQIFIAASVAPQISVPARCMAASVPPPLPPHPWMARGLFAAATWLARLPPAPVPQRLPCDVARVRCAGGLAPIGGALQVELLALPPPARRAGGWVVREVGAQPRPRAGLPQKQAWWAQSSCPPAPPAAYVFRPSSTILFTILLYVMCACRTSVVAPSLTHVRR